MKMLTPLDSITGGCLAQMLCNVTTAEWELICVQVSVKKFAKPVGSYVSIFWRPLNMPQFPIIIKF